MESRLFSERLPRDVETIRVCLVCIQQPVLPNSVFWLGLFLGFAVTAASFLAVYRCPLYYVTLVMEQFIVTKVPAYFQCVQTEQLRLNVSRYSKCHLKVQFRTFTCSFLEKVEASYLF